MAGADVCGFSGDTTPELCARWVGVAALHPFFRDHSDLSAAPQELYRWPETVAAARAALGGLRYALLPSIYTALARASRTGAPAARPLWFEWPGVAGARADRPQWMVGDALMAVPVVQPAATYVAPWLPPGTAWVDVRRLLGGGEIGENGGGSVHLLRSGTNATLGAHLSAAPPVLLRCGRAVPIAAPRQTAEATLVGARLGIVACLDADGAATGELFADDGLTELSPGSSAWWDVRVDGQGLSLDYDGARLVQAEHWPRLERVVVVGVEVAGGRVRADACGQVVEGTLRRRGDGSVLEAVFGDGGVRVVCADGTSGVRVEWGGGEVAAV
jgi:alpha-glucosidase